MKQGFWKAGHWPTLLASFLYFDISFLVWVILGPLGPFLGESLSLTATQKGFLVAAPLLTGSLFRPLMGMLADRIGGRRAALFGMLVTAIPLLLGWRFALRLDHFLLIGVLLGVAGASFAVALPLASRWYPPQYQGLAMGIAGAGNSGTVLATLFLPRLASYYGWQNAFALALLPLGAVLIAFLLLAKEPPASGAKLSLAAYRSLLQQTDTSWFCFYYGITFGGFVGLASLLTVFLVDQYNLPKVKAGDLVTLAVLAGSALRPAGGWIADRFGGYRVLLGVYASVAMLVTAMSALPPVWQAIALLVATLGVFGLGNGAVFQLVPQRFANTIGAITGLVGAAGGIGGFLLPSAFGVIKDWTGSYAGGFLLVGLLSTAGFTTLLHLGSRWTRDWEPAAGARSGVFCYRSWLGAREAA
jgi:NNP family nitrate/nitrite transporter-like MFS transporter